MMTDRAVSATKKRSWTDWVGFFTFVLLACWTILTSPGFGIYLLPTIFAEVFVAVTFLIRREPRQSIQGIIPTALAYGGTFWMLTFNFIARIWVPQFIVATTNPTLHQVGQIIWTIGVWYALWPLWYMRRSFSIEPEARELVTAGPYRLARHPIYAGYVIQYEGLLLMYPTVAFGMALALFFLLTRGRIHYEERVLRQAFPEYAAYAERVGMLGPKF